VVGCGNVHYAEFLKIPLTSVDQASEQIGERAGELALSLIQTKGRPGPRQFFWNRDS